MHCDPFNLTVLLLGLNPKEPNMGGMLVLYYKVPPTSAVSHYCGHWGGVMAMRNADCA